MDEEKFFWRGRFERMREIKDYEDLSTEINRILDKKELSEEDKNRLSEILTIWWRRIIIEACSGLRNRIQSRRTRGQTFSENERQLDRLKRIAERNLEPHEYEEIFLELKNQHMEIEEKISIEKYQSTRFRNGIFLGFFLGIIASILAALVLGLF